MATDKKLRLGGMENSPPKADQSANRFKVANNVTFTNEGYLAPRSSMEGFSDSYSISGYLMKKWTHFSSYTPSPANTPEILKFGISSEGNGFRQLFIGNTPVPCPNNNLGEEPSVVDDNQFCDQSVEINKVKYLLSAPSKSNQALLKYDGVEAYGAGIGDPTILPVNYTNFGGYFSTTYEWNTKTNLSNKYVKVVGHSLDFQGNQITSDTVSYNLKGFPTVLNSITAKQIYDIDSKEYDSLYVGVGYNGVAYSKNGIDWESDCIGAIKGSLVKYSSTLDIFIIPVNGSGVYTSKDGRLWDYIPVAQFSNKTWYGIAEQDGVFVLVGSDSSGASNSIAKSSDGVTWTLVTAPVTTTITCIAYGSNASGTISGFVALSNDKCLVSTDYGATWTAKSSGIARDWTCLVWSSYAGLWVAANNNGPTTFTQIYTITNPFSAVLNWTARSSPLSSNPWSAIAEYDGTFVLCSESINNSNRIATSPDGINWTLRTFAPSDTSMYFKCAIASLEINSEPAFILGGIVSPTTTVYTNTYNQATRTAAYCPVNSLTTWTEIETPWTSSIITGVSALSSAYFDFYNQTNNVAYGDVPSDMAPVFYGDITSYSSTTNEFTFSLGPSGNNWGTITATEGTYIMIPISYLRKESGATKGRFTAMALKYKGGDKFYGSFKLYSPALGWVDMNGWDTDWLASTSVWQKRHFGARRFYSIWASSSENGIYYFKTLIPSGNLSTPLYPYNFFGSVWNFNVRFTNIENSITKSTDFPFSIAPQLNSWYDTTSVKFPFNYITSKITVSANTSVTPNIPAKSSFEPMITLTTYQDLLVIATENQIYFSDTTFGGSIEMCNGFSSLVIGESQYGRITSIVGTKDYLIVSREKKVYMVAGSLTTANIRVQEIPDLPIGAYSNTSMVEVYGTIFMMASSGAWLINAANSKKVSNVIPLNFKSIFKTSVSQLPSVEQDSLGLNLNYYPTTAYQTYNSGPMGAVPKTLLAVFDAIRSRVIITNANQSGGQSLVFHTEFGEWTTFDCYDSDNNTNSVTAMTFVDGIMYVGNYKQYDNKCVTSYENPTHAAYDYMVKSPSKLVTTWMTQGEPSLEKQLLQFKLFGYLPSGAKYSIKHYENWDYTTPITNVTYTSLNSNCMFHKQRLNSSKPMSAAIEFTMSDQGNLPNFWIEGFEVEFEQIQRGMKR